ncbi:SMC family ATPase [Tardisphaera miroshnichenkoae]
MIIESLEMENIRSHRSTTVRFDEGVTLIEGDVGSGKSSMLKAIQFALFGSGDPRSLLSYGKDEGRVTLSFRVADRRYVVVRSLHRVGDKVRTTKGYWQDETSAVPMSASQLNEKVMEVLGIKGSERARRLPIWEYAFYTPQERLKAILSDKEVRSNAISAAFNTQKYKRAVINAQRLTAYLSNEVLKYESYSSDLEAKEQELKGLQKQVTSVEGDLKKAQAELEAARAERDRAKADHDQADRAFNEAALTASGLQHEVDVVSSDVKSDAVMIHEIERRIEENKAKLAGIVAELSKPLPSFRPSSEVKSEMNELQGQIYAEQLKATQMRGRLEDYQKALRQLPKSPPRLSRSLQDVEREIEAIQDQLNELKSVDMELRRFDQSYDEMAQKGKCPCCGREIDRDLAIKLKEDASRKRDEIKRQISQLTERVSKLKAERDAVADLQRKLDLYENQKSTVNDLEKELTKMLNDEGLQEQGDIVAAVQEAIEGISKRIDYMRSQVRELNDELNRSIELEKEVSLRQRLEGEKEEIERSIEDDGDRVAKLKDDMKTKEEQLKVLKEQLGEALSKRDAALSAANIAKEAYEAAEERLGEKLSAYRSLNAKRADLKDRIALLSREVDDKRDARARASEAREVVDWLKDLFIPLVIEIEQEVLARLNQEFQDKFSAFFSVLIGDPQKKVYTDEEFSPKMEHGGIEMDIDEGPSGGERSSMALAYRLALNEVAREVAGLSVDLIILDEPTDGFSSEQLSRFRELIDALNARQVIVVSHEKELESAADRIIVTSKEGEASSVQLLQ